MYTTDYVLRIDKEGTDDETVDLAYYFVGTTERTEGPHGGSVFRTIPVTDDSVSTGHNKFASEHEARTEADRLNAEESRKR